MRLRTRAQKLDGRNQYGTSAVIPQASFRGETSSGVAKRRLLSQTNYSLKMLETLSFHNKGFQQILLLSLRTHLILENAF